jgi:signal peptidase I
VTEPNNAKSAGEYVSTAPDTSALGDAKAKSAKALRKEAHKKAQKAHPWRDNIEAVAISIVTIVLFKYFVLEAYKIPTGSMQPTLMGNAETGIYDRVIVDKFSYHYRDPERFEIAVFKYPLDSSKNFIKRIVGMPGEIMYLAGGDIWVQPPGEEARPLRRPRPIQDAQLRRIETNGEWSSPRPEGWNLDTDEDSDRIRASGSGSMTFPRSGQSIADGYLDGYPKGVKSKISEKNKGSGYNDVSDLRVALDLEFEAGIRACTVVLHEGDRRFRFTIQGPGGDGAAPAIAATGPGFDGQRSSTEKALQLKAGQSVEVEVQNLNDLLEFRIDGDLVASMEIPAADSEFIARHDMDSRVEVEVDAEGSSKSSFDDVKIWRDIFYTQTAGRNPVTRWQIPEDQYLVLGDNSQDSSDGRDWSLSKFRVQGEGDAPTRIVRGNSRERQILNPSTGQMVSDPASNPRYAPQQAGAKEIFLRDEFGELHVLDAHSTERLPDEHLSFVPRDLIRGRAVVVVWPFAFQYDVYRLKWVR